MTDKPDAEPAMKSCFVICPIGDEGTKTRRQSDSIYEYIIKPSLIGFGYDEPVRVDKADKPTHITTEIIQHLVNADLVIADLSSLNANVFYELGIRHAYQKPCILISDWEHSPPFDVAGINTIKYVYDDPRSHAAVTVRIREQINALEKTPTVSNPVTVALGFASLSETGDSKDQLIIAIAEKLENVSSEVKALKYDVAHRAVVDALVANTGRNALADLYANHSASPKLGSILTVSGEKPNALAGVRAQSDEFAPSLGDILGATLSRRDQPR